jgi:hypothetical protein
MFNIDQKSVQKLIEINKLLNVLEVRGASNVSALYSSMVMLNEVLNEIDKATNNIVIDNTKGG